MLSGTFELILLPVLKYTCGAAETIRLCCLNFCAKASITSAEIPFSKSRSTPSILRPFTEYC